MPMVNTLGIDPIHFGLVVTLNSPSGQQTPPVASVLMTACAIAKSDIWETTKVNLPYIAALLFVLLLCTYVPLVSLGFCTCSTAGGIKRPEWRGAVDGDLKNSACSLR